MIIAIILSIIAFIVNVIVLIRAFTYRGVNHWGEDINIDHPLYYPLKKFRLRMYLYVFISVLVQNYFIYYTFFKYPSTETYQEKIACKDLYYERCGMVVKKMEGIERRGKHHNEYYQEWMVIKFTDGKFERREVSRNTFEKYNIGEGICFAEDNYKNQGFRLTKEILLGVLYFIALIIGIVSITEEI